MKPQPRPALKRAEDADLHPALVIDPTQQGGARGSSDAGPARLAKADKDAGKGSQGPGGKGKPKKGRKRKSEPAGKRYQAAGRATSDSLRPGRDKDGKPVTLKVQVPKRVRSEVRAIARHSGSSVDAIVAQALSDWLGDPRRW